MLIFPFLIGSYGAPGLPELPEEAIAEEQSKVELLLREFGGTSVPWDVPPRERRQDAVSDRFYAWITSGPGDTFLHWITHGDFDGADGGLPLAGSSLDQRVSHLSADAFKTAITQRLVRDADNLVLAVVDACFSAPFIRKVASLLDDDSGTAKPVLLVGTAEAETGLGAFSHRFTAALRSFEAVNEIAATHLAAELGRLGLCVRPLDISNHILHRVHRVPSGAFTLEFRQEFRALVAELDDHERTHFVPKAKGSDLGEPSWYFEGRSQERGVLAAWLRNATSGLLAVTGRAGSGKSAFLGDAVVQSTPELRDLLIRHHRLTVVGDADRPADHAFDTVIHLTGLGPEEVLTRLEEFAGLTSTTPLDVSDRVAALSAHLVSHPMTLLTDALDEARDPLRLATEVLRPLASLSGVRVIVGTRASTLEGPDQPAPEDTDLLEALDPHTVLGITRDPSALTTYLRRRLAAAFPTLPPASLDAAAHTLASHPSHGFLFAYLAVHEIAADPALLSSIADLAASDHRSLFTRAVTRLATEATETTPLLHALACSQGRGLPLLDGIWTTAAASLSPTPITHDHAATLLTAAAPYVIADTDHGQTVFRLAHATFTEHFTDRAAPDTQHRIAIALIAQAESTHSSLNPYLVHHLPSHTAAAGAEALTDLANAVRTLDRVRPDALAEARQHPLAALPAPLQAVIGVSDALGRLDPPDRSVLRQLSELRYTGELGRANPNAPVHVAWASLRSQPPHRVFADYGSPVTAVATFTAPNGRIHLVAGCEDGTVSIRDLQTGTPPTDLVPELEAVARPGVAKVTGLAVFPIGGSPVLLTMQNTPGPLLWDLKTGKMQHAITWPDSRLPSTFGIDWEDIAESPSLLNTIDPRSLKSLTLLNSPQLKFFFPPARMLSRRFLFHSGNLGNRWPFGYDNQAMSEFLSHLTDRLGKGIDPVYLAAELSDGGVIVFDSRADRVLYQTSRGASLKFSDAEDGTILVRGGRNGVVEVRRVEDPEPLRTWFGHAGNIQALTMFMDSSGRRQIVSGGDDATVRIWEYAEGDPTSGSAQSGRSPVVTAFSDMAGVRIVMGGDEGFRMVDPEGRTAHWSVRGTGAVASLTSSTKIGVRPILIVGGADGRISGWDLEADEPRYVRRGHRGPIQELVTCELRGGGRRVVSRGTDAMVGVWEPTSGQRLAWVKAPRSGLRVTEVSDALIIKVGSAKREVALRVPHNGPPERRWRRVQRSTDIDAEVVLTTPSGRFRLIRDGKDSLKLLPVGEGTTRKIRLGAEVLSLHPLLDGYLVVGLADGVAMLKFSRGNIVGAMGKELVSERCSAI